MKAAWVLCVVGCYQPSAEGPCTISCTTTCPAHLTCRSGWCTGENGPTCAGDGGVIADGTEDAPQMPLCTPATTGGNETQLTFGFWFTARLGSEPYAIKFLNEDDGNGGTVGAVRGTNGNPGAIYSLLFSDTNAVAYRSPHVSPDGLDLFMRIEPMLDAVYIARSRRTAGTNAWSNPTNLTITGMSALALTDDPSTPTMTSPRRMVISHGPNGFTEIREADDSTWGVVRNQPELIYMTDDAKAVSFLGEAHLNEDGRRLVFRGQVQGQLIGAWYLDRANLGVPFASPARQLPTGSSVQYPFFTSDCKFLFYSRAADNFTYRVAYP